MLRGTSRIGSLGRRARRLALIGVMAILGVAAAPGAALAGAGGPGSAIDWAPCARADLEGLQCATFPVPTDRSAPAAGTFELALVRARATGPRRARIGTLFFNPGGPGGSGRDFMPTMVEVLPADVRARFDIVSWDPRGIGDTRPALEGCDGPWVDRPATGPVDWRDVVARHAAAIAEVNRACRERNAAFIEHIGTIDVVDDLDALRAAVGDERLNYVGMSYGTRIGYVYAMRHPDRVGRIVLDGTVNPIESTDGLTRTGALGNDEALGYYFQRGPRARARFETALRLLQERPIDLGGGEVYTRWRFVDQTMLMMGFEDNHVAIGRVADAVRIALEGSGARQEEAKELLRRVTRAQGPNTDSGGPFSIVNCLDYPQRPTLAEMQDIVVDVGRRAPIYGASLATSYVTGCEGLDLTPKPVPLATPSASPAPILVASATRDARTPYAWAVQMARAFPASRMLTYPGAQHVITVRPSRCSARVTSTYLIKRRLPARDVACPAPRPARAQAG
jgi:pimeloyl-ACP methyl ester carboxylesterase